MPVLSPGPVLNKPLLPAWLLLVCLLLAACEDDAPAPVRRVPLDTTAVVSGRASGQAAGASASLAPTGTTRALPSSELHLDRTEAFYTVTGSSTRALLDDLVRHGPRIGSERHFGRTSWTARWNFTYEEPAGGATPAHPCRMHRVDVYMDVEVTLPRWEVPSSASPTLQRNWQSFADALAFHEREHQESTISAGRRVVRALEDLQAPSCAALKEKANTTARTIIEEARAYNRRYDERTGHGRTQGARWPLY